MSKDNGMSMQRKGDLYRKKRKLYLAAAKNEGGEHLQYPTMDTAEDTLARFTERKEKKMRPMPVANEFGSYPPSAAGQMHYADAVAGLMQIRDYLADVLAGKEVSGGEAIAAVFESGADEMYEALSRVISDYFAAAGYDPESGETIDPETKKAGREAFEESRAKYAALMGKLLNGYGRDAIEKERKEAGIGERIHATVPDYDEVFDKLLADDPGGRVLYEDYLDMLSGMVEVAERETAERHAARDAVMERIFSKYFWKDAEPNFRRFITRSFLEYHYNVDLICRRLSYVRTACMYYGVWLVKEVPLDAIAANKIKEILHIEVDQYDDNTPLSRIPGFFVPSETDDEEFTGTDLSALMTGIADVRHFVLKNPELIDAQCLVSIVTGTEDLGAALHKARGLSRTIDAFTVSEGAKDLAREEWRQLFDGWVMTETFCRVAELVVEFVTKHKETTVGEATRDMEVLLTELSYAAVERRVRVALRQIVLERSGFFAAK